MRLGCVMSLMVMVLVGCVIPEVKVEQDAAPPPDGRESPDAGVTRGNECEIACPYGQPCFQGVCGGAAPGRRGR